MRALIVYATREGQTRRIAMRMADDLRAHGSKVDVFNADSIGTLDWSKYFTACIAASVHAGKHEPEMVAFARTYRDELQRLHAAFISVTLSEATVEGFARSEDERRQAAGDVQRMIDDFVKATGWTPARTLPVAGALTYSKYNIFMRFVMKRIARKAGGPTDTSRDYEFTDWPAVEQFARQLGAGREGEIV